MPDIGLDTKSANVDKRQRIQPQRQKSIMCFRNPKNQQACRAVRKLEKGVLRLEWRGQPGDRNVNHKLKNETWNGHLDYDLQSLHFTLKYLHLPPRSGSSRQRPDDSQSGKQQWWLKKLHPCHSHERPGLSPWLPAWPWPSPSHCRPLRSRPENQSPLSFQLLT